MGDLVPVGNLPFMATREEILERFKVAGHISDITMLKNEDGHFMGVAIIKMSSPEQAAYLVQEFKGQSIGEREMDIKLYSEVVANLPQ